MAPGVDSYYTVPAPPERGAATGLLGISYDGIAQLRSIAPRYRAAALVELNVALKASLRLGLTTVIPLLPEDQGNALRALKAVTTGTSLSDVSGWFGWDDLDYGANLEFGRAPGSWPPVEKIDAWAARHFGSYLSNASGYMIAKKIYEQGIPGRHMFEQTYAEILPEVEALFSAAIGRAVDAV